MGKRITTESFIERSNIIHNNKYQYNIENIDNIKDIVEIICPIHGKYKQRVSDHLSNCGCPKCSGRNKSTEEIIYEFKQIFGDRYDYSKFIYTGSRNKSIVICKEHGEFLITPHHHRNRKQGCCKCSGHNRTIEELIKLLNETHNNKYDYINIKSTKTQEKANIICKEHGEFLQKLDDHIMGHGCPGCKCEKIKMIRTKSFEQFIFDINQIHHNLYDYSLSNYINNKTQIDVICKEHGVFKIRPDLHLQGNGCPACSESKGEKIIRGVLLKNNIKFKGQHTNKQCRHKNLLRFDFAIYDNLKQNVLFLIEFQGEQHFSPIKFCTESDKYNADEEFKNLLIRDEIKRNFCKTNNIPLLEIKYNQIKECESIILDFIQKNV